MVIISRVAVFPVPDKAAEVQSVLEGYIRSNPNKIRNSLWRVVLGELPAFSAISLFDSLEDYEKNRDANIANPDYVQAVAKFNPMLRQPTITRLATSIVDPVGDMNAGGRYTQQVILLPTNQGQETVRNIVVDFATGQQAEGRPLFRATQAIFAHDGPAFSLMDSYETLAELDNVRRHRTDKAAELWSSLGSNLRAPTMNRLREVILPFDR